MNLTLDIVWLVLGFYLLAKGSSWLVTGSTMIADGLGVRPLIIGLTVVAWGTSAPEVVVSGVAALDGRPAIAMGNVLGSNVANIALVLGACAVILPAVLNSRLAFREIFWVIVSVGALWWVSADLLVSRLDAVILLGVFALYNLQLFLETAKRPRLPRSAIPHSDNWFERHAKTSVLLGAAAIALGADRAIEGATGIAELAGISDRVIGLTAVAIGTSLPELAAGVSGALKGHKDISLGNVVGSNVFNVLAVIGIVGLIKPFGGADEPAVRDALQANLDFDFIAVAGFTVAVVILPMLGKDRGGRMKGGLLLLAYAVYVWFLFARDTLPIQGAH